MLDYLPILVTFLIGVVGLFMKGGVQAPLAKVLLLLIGASATLTIYGKFLDNERKVRLDLLARSTGIDPSRSFETAIFVLGIPERDGETDNWYDYEGIGDDLLFGVHQSGDRLGRLELVLDWDLSYVFDFRRPTAIDESEEDLPSPIFIVEENNGNGDGRRWNVLWGNCEVPVEETPKYCEDRTNGGGSAWWSDLVAGGTAHGVELDNSFPAAFWLSALEQRSTFGNLRIFADTPEIRSYYKDVVQAEFKFYPLRGEGAISGCVPVLKQKLRLDVVGVGEQEIVYGIRKDGERSFVHCEDSGGVG